MEDDAAISIHTDPGKYVHLSIPIQGKGTGRSSVGSGPWVASWVAMAAASVTRAARPLDTKASNTTKQEI
jgi:hypothetical protein